MHRQVLAEAVRGFFGNHRVLVVGDVMLDRYLWGDVRRVSPEAPVPVLRPNHEAERAGGAGNLALNTAGLGLQTSLAGYVGDDDKAERLRRRWRDSQIHSDLVMALQDRPTTTKTRIIAGHQHVLRVDDEDLNPVTADTEERMLASLIDRLDAVDALMLSDYGKNVLTEHVCKHLIVEARRKGLSVLVDPNGRDFRKYAGATVLTPNLKELEQVTGVPAHQSEELIQAGRRMIAEFEIGAIVLTQSEKGMTYIDRDEIVHSPAIAQEVFDVSGAGDTVIAALAAGMLADLSRANTLQLANVAAGIVVGKVGTAPIERDELLHALDPHGRFVEDAIYTPERLERAVTTWRSQGERIVFTNGCFDVLHAGHVACLQKAADHGDHLIVALNTDRSARALKGEGRPIVHQQDRAFLISALRVVDAVVLFDEETPLELITALRPDVIVKAADYTEETVVGAKEVKSWGGDVVLVPLVDDMSTTDLIHKIKGLE